MHEKKAFELKKALSFREYIAIPVASTDMMMFNAAQLLAFIGNDQSSKFGLLDA
jgi:hypothetical protein